MRLVGIILFLVLVPCLAAGQSYLLEKGQSGMFFAGDFASNKGVIAVGVGGGYAFGGVADMGFGIGKGTGSRWMISQGLDVLVSRSTDEKLNSFFLALSEQYSILGLSFLPNDGSVRILTLGGSANSRLSLGSMSALLLSIGYYRVMPTDGSTSTGMISFGCGFAMYGSRRVTSINFHAFVEGESTTLGLSMSIGKAYRRSRNGNHSGSSWE